MKKLKKTCLCTILVSLLATSPAIARSGTNNTNTSSWKNDIISNITAGILLLSLAEIIAMVRTYFNKEDYEHEKLKSFVAMNKELKKQLDYAKANCYKRKIVKEMEQAYLNSCIKIMKMQKKYFEKYAQA